MKNERLVYSTNPELNKRCPRCKEVVSECTCSATPEMPDNIFATLNIETAKRGGKKVTVIKNLPAIEGYLKDLAKDLKQKCGTGGTHGIDSESGYIEIQGDRRTDLRPLLLARKINVKG